MDEINLAALYYQALNEIAQLRSLLDSLENESEDSVTVYELYRANYELAEEVVKLRHQLMYAKIKITPKSVFKCECPCYYQHASQCINNTTLC